MIAQLEELILHHRILGTYILRRYTCAECKCQVSDGGGSILPTEQSHFNYKQQTDNWRLSCQVPVKSDMKIQIPDEVFGVKEWECEVVSNDNVATFIKELVH